MVFKLVGKFYVSSKLRKTNIINLNWTLLCLFHKLNKDKIKYNFLVHANYRNASIRCPESLLKFSTLGGRLKEGVN
jgi:hypothetical protein